MSLLLKKILKSMNIVFFYCLYTHGNHGQAIAVQPCKRKSLSHRKLMQEQLTQKYREGINTLISETKTFLECLCCSACAQKLWSDRCQHAPSAHVHKLSLE
ncbi:hypothetical protein XENOCAPTIV_028435 [Xenoophorus captivus]|uniref:Uncharacterized protein n=1 Tax=Xenoophorus captivus TaxID=1517983 RepID=A0ABV0QFY3_9TELE